MNRFLVDTSAYLAFMTGHTAVSEALGSADDLYFNPIVLGEIYRGFRETRPKTREDFDEFVSSSRVGFIEVDDQTSEHYAVIANFLQKKGTLVSANDIWIAASAMQHGLAVLSLDRDFLRIPQILTICPEGPSSSLP